jgi:hypothetical protein
MCWECLTSDEPIIAVYADSKTLGIRCAKRLYGADFIDEVMYGYMRPGHDGLLIMRYTRQEISESNICQACENLLRMCSAQERKP